MTKNFWSITLCLSNIFAFFVLGEHWLNIIAAGLALIVFFIPIPLDTRSDYTKDCLIALRDELKAIELKKREERFDD